MIKEFYLNKRWFLWAWAGAVLLIGSLYAQVYMSVLFNEWYGRFYNLFQPNLGGTIEQFWSEFGYFGKVASVYIALAIWTNWFTRIYAFRWRKAITFEYISKWRNVKEEVEGASQRIQEDAFRFTRTIESLGLQIVRALMTIIAFLPILWKLSENVVITLISWEVPLISHAPGNLVWVACIATAAGMLISWFVGWYLPELEYNNQVVEAEFRKDLVHGEDDKIHYAIPKTLAKLFFGLEYNYHRLYLHYGYFDLWYNIYAQLMTILPYVVVGPSVVLGAVPLGVLVQVSNAFGKVQGSLSLFIENWTTITELRSIWRRLHEFERNIDKHTSVTEEELKSQQRTLYEYKFGITIWDCLGNWCKGHVFGLTVGLPVAGLVLCYIYLAVKAFFNFLTIVNF